MCVCMCVCVCLGYDMEEWRSCKGQYAALAPDVREGIQAVVVLKVKVIKGARKRGKRETEREKVAD